MPSSNFFFLSSLALCSEIVTGVAWGIINDAEDQRWVVMVSCVQDKPLPIFYFSGPYTFLYISKGRKTNLSLPKHTWLKLILWEWSRRQNGDDFWERYLHVHISVFESLDTIIHNRFNINVLGIWCHCTRVITGEC